MPVATPAVAPAPLVATSGSPAPAEAGHGSAGAIAFRAQLAGAVAREGDPTISPGPRASGSALAGAGATDPRATATPAVSEPTAAAKSPLAASAVWETDTPQILATVPAAILAATSAKASKPGAAAVASLPASSSGAPIKTTRATDRTGTGRRGAGATAPAATSPEPVTQSQPLSVPPTGAQEKPAAALAAPSHLDAAGVGPRAGAETPSSIPVAGPGDRALPPQAEGQRSADIGANPVPIAPSAPDVKAVPLPTSGKVATPGGGVAEPASATPATAPAAAPRASTAADPSARTSLASAAQQVAAPLVAVATAPDGGRHLTVRLDPEALGSVQIHVERPTDGPARVSITVERPETMSLLLRDEGQLQRALDGAGIPPEGRSLTFQLASSETPRAEPHSLSAGLDGGGSTGGGEGGGTRRQATAGDDETAPDRTSRALRWARAGLDITA